MKENSGFIGIFGLERGDLQNLKDVIGKVIEISKPKAGNWYISVFCNTTVNTEETTYGTRYTGRLDVLNGVPYIIKVEY